MKLLPGLVGIVLLLTSCARDASSAGGGRSDVRCELLGLEAADDEQATATFRFTNQGDAPFTYRGYSPDGPLYECEVLEGGTWQASLVGWCGTGLSEQRLEPGRSIEFTAALPRDGRSYRFTIGEPAVRTPEVSSPR